jgi:hypothetical protein
MTIKIKSLTVKNFMSIGNVSQAINFDTSKLTLVLGENLDLGGDDNGARNGTGKCIGSTSILKIRNATSGEQFEITAADFYQMAILNQSKKGNP